MVESMTQLNRVAGEALGRYNVHAATDITGFGLMGHGREMAVGSNVTLEIDHTPLEFLPGALDYARQGIFPGGQKNNKLFAQVGGVRWRIRFRRKWRGCFTTRRLRADC